VLGVRFNQIATGNPSDFEKVNDTTYRIINRMAHVLTEH